MNVQLQNTTWSREALMTANFQLQTLYQQDGNPCLALMISRNYHLLLDQSHSLKEQKDWSDKAKIWQKLYSKSRINKIPNVFYDESGLYYDSV
ncbi:hypothetical protein A9Q79_06120 [Methylophaga sp. 42_25_T18]|nr:hypothetical protein A9Q79_06120 [Methylophaga sp. 42_25_T18]OUR86697.1 hypothetical protein A9Q92_05250 [Methylophaga sp. 42_8_T64]